MKRKGFLLFSLLVILGLIVTISSCQKDNDTDPDPEDASIIKDIEGNTYRTVKIGNQIWMAENLRTTLYNDSTSIAKIEDGDNWEADIVGAYCWYNNDKQYKNKYGALYNWYAVNSGKIAPKGWHVPTNAEIKELERFLGMSEEEIGKIGQRGTIEGDKLKSTTGWDSDGNGIDEYGFAALPGGRRNESNSFERVSQFGYFWSSTALSGKNAWSRILYYHLSKIGKYSNIDKHSGLSIRCIKD